MDAPDVIAMQILQELGLSALLFCSREGNAGSRTCERSPGFPYVGIDGIHRPGSFLALKSALLVAGSGIVRTKFWSIEGWALAHCS